MKRTQESFDSTKERERERLQTKMEQITKLKEESSQHLKDMKALQLEADKLKVIDYIFLFLNRFDTSFLQIEKRGLENEIKLHQEEKSRNTKQEDSLFERISDLQKKNKKLESVSLFSFK